MIGSSYAREAPARHDFAIDAPVQPMAVRVDGRWQVSYELHLTNTTRGELRLTRAAVLGEPNEVPLADLSGAVLTGDLALVSAVGRAKADPALIAPGLQAVLFLDIVVPGPQVPRVLRHRFSYTVASNGKTLTQWSHELAVDSTKPSLIAPPLRGGPWVAIHSSAWPRGHRRVFYTRAGRARLPGRFAIDFVKVDDKGRMTAGDPDLVRDAFGYGDDVLAVADATVAAVHDGMDEASRISARTTPPTDEDAGNYVALRLPDGRFAFYEHLKKGSVRVAAGDKVRTGEVIGSLGFSGESTGPHLHFHVADASTPLGAEGRPFEIRSYRKIGRYDDISKLGSPWMPLAPGKSTMREGEWPDGNDVVVFP
jgi:murein DD-endopeptidase